MKIAPAFADCLPILLSRAAVLRERWGVQAILLLGPAGAGDFDAVGSFFNHG